MRLEVRNEEGNGATSSLLCTEAEEGGAGQLGEQSAGVRVGVPQSLQSCPGAETAGALWAAPGNRWLPQEEAVGGKLYLSINTSQPGELTASGGSELPVSRGIQAESGEGVEGEYQGRLDQMMVETLLATAPGIFLGHGSGSGGRGSCGRGLGGLTSQIGPATS